MVTCMTYEMPKNENIILTYFMLYHLFSFFAAQHIGIYSEKVRTIFFDLNFFFHKSYIQYPDICASYTGF